ncbi:MAG: serine/threonine protein phosphatase [Boseongicola sp. SB0676_bin_33]|uniref:Serine/threonine protein phosphatase n=1 Tax=Boseongicola sp. SB0664_bin_43 TaxID=2604844 RepID=A0A6B0Y047_9RHOB|nr:serine/threonine protein phosphatase [Boseongicola sp. SB0664_bin_43]MYF89135.1 serine/threonine protein phosphatase [Boseongicola sp. SB0676_bin_33]MYK32275.1 serine/threonine protein phosphatase [Boseongicola sp. SB0670_bin_30]
MNILAFSDLHHSKAKAEALVSMSRAADLVIGAGDFCNMRNGLDDAMRMLDGIGCTMVVVPGNAESAEELRDAARAGTIVLHGEGTEFEGLRLFGLGYGVPVTPFGSWSCDLDEAAAAAMLQPCRTADILVTHSPPKGVADATSNGTSVGSESIREAIERVQPKLALCGHIHDSWGRSGQLGKSRVCNLGPSGRIFEIAP